MTTARGTDGSLLASLPWTLLALSVALAPHLPYLAIWITGAFIGCATWRFAIEKRRRPLPRRIVRGGLALICFLGVLATYSSISGVGPGSALLAIMAALKLLETRRRRDQFVLLFISIFLVMSSLLREQYMWSLPYLFVSLFVIMTAWLQISAGERQSAKASFRSGGRFLAYAAPVALAMWVLFPRLATPFWAVPIDTSQATTGISDSMSPGDISNLSQSDAVAFRVQFEGDVPEPRDLYWRGLVLNSFNGRTWSASTSIDARGTALDQITPRGNPVRYTVTMEPTRQQYVFALELPTRWEGMSQMRMGPEQQLWRVTPISQRVAFQAESYTDYTLTAGNRKPSSWYLRLPENGNARTRQLAQDMRSAADSETAFVDAVMQMFNEQDFYYTLQPPALGSNPVDRFLFDSRRGFCEHYASAFTFMMRSAGLPARVVVGYQGGEVNPLGGHMVVRQSDAHAWSEVWIERYGWYRVDPTSAVAPERIEYGTRDPAYEELAASWGFSSSSQILYDLQMTWDAIDAKWNEWILGYGPEKQNEFLEKLGLEDPDWRSMILIMVAAVVAIILAVSLLLMLRYRPPPTEPALRIYNAFVRRTGQERAPAETPIEFAQRIQDSGRYSAADIAAITQSYLDVRYGPTTATELANFKKLVSETRPRAA